jgi:hypothetical protein
MSKKNGNISFLEEKIYAGEDDNTHHQQNPK